MARYQCSHYEQKPIKIKNQAGFIRIGWWCQSCGAIKITHMIEPGKARWFVPASATEWNKLKKELQYYMEQARRLHAPNKPLKPRQGIADT